MAAVTLYTTWPSLESAEACARALVEARLAACCTLWPGAVSIYRWEGALARDLEVVLLVKTNTQLAAAARAAIVAQHPYALPCVAAWPIAPDESHPAYLAWIEQETLPADDR